MFEAENIRDWRGHDVVDTDGHKIGALEAIYVDTGTDLPSFATVTVGMVGRHRLVFVPLDRATVGPGYLKVLYSRKQVKDAPSIETDGERPTRRRSSSTTAWSTSRAPAVSGGWAAAEGYGSDGRFSPPAARCSSRVQHSRSSSSR
jgi:hypothetical protein